MIAIIGKFTGCVGIFAFLFCFACSSLYAHNHMLSLILENGDFKFFVMRGNLAGHVCGVFRESERRPDRPSPAHMKVTSDAGTCLRRLQSADGMAVLQIDHLFINIGSDRKIFLCTVPHWSGNSPGNDRVFIRITSDAKHGFDVNYKSVQSQVYFRNAGQNFEVLNPYEGIGDFSDLPPHCLKPEDVSKTSRLDEPDD